MEIKFLSENYLQHADHFTRVLNERESFRKDKFLENNSENNSELLWNNLKILKNSENLADTSNEKI